MGHLLRAGSVPASDADTIHPWKSLHVPPGRGRVNPVTRRERTADTHPSRDGGQVPHAYTSHRSEGYLRHHGHMTEARHHRERERASHSRWMDRRNRKREEAEYKDEWYPEQCGRCEFWVPLAGEWGLDWVAARTLGLPSTR